MPEVALERAAAIGWIITRDLSRVMAHPECMVRRFKARWKGNRSGDGTRTERHRMPQTATHREPATRRRAQARRGAGLCRIDATATRYRTVETLAEKIGQSEKYLYARLRLMLLVDEVQPALYTGKPKVAHAFEIARLTPDVRP
jgi:hypothetical protein